MYLAILLRSMQTSYNFHCSGLINYNRSRSIHSRRNEEAKRNKQGNQNENDYLALSMEKTRHKGKSAGMKLQSILEKSPESLGVWMPQIILGFHMTSSKLQI